MTTSNDVALYDGGQLDAYRPQIMTPEAAAELDGQLRACTRAVLKPGTDYGTLPGTNDKNVLFKPGAEKLLQWFGLSYSCERLEIERDDDGRKEGVTYRASVVRRLPDGRLMPIATCDGYAGYDEDKFYQSTEAAQAKAEAKERHFAKIDGRPANPTKWKNLTGEYRAPWNTVIKMAQKRAIVGAVINATAAGGLFTTDDDSDQAPADGAPSWYQQALGEAAAFTTKEDGRALYAEVTRAKLSGALTRDQADHIQNRIKQRVEQLETHIQADVEHLTPADPHDASPASRQLSPVAAESVTHPEPAGEAPKKNGSASGLIVGHFERLGVTDRNDRLILTAQLARLDDVPSTTSKLTAKQQREVLSALEKCRNQDALQALLTAGEQDTAAEVPDGA